MPPRCIAAVLSSVVAALLLPGAAHAARSLDGHADNLRHPAWGEAGTPYVRIAPARYADGVSAMVGGPAPRRVSNRIFNDLGQNVFSARGLSQWVWAWGQFIDHDIGLADETPGESAPLAFDPHDPLESFTDDAGGIDFNRTPAAPGTGVNSPRQQVNTVSSYIDASQVYGETAQRLAWLRQGASLLLPHGYLPRADARPNPPHMDLFGAQPAAPGRAVVAGDVRANENLALTAVQTLFAREHNRIVGRLRRFGGLSAEQRFQIARRVVGAEIQFITYRQFLPALGVRLAPYRGYRPNVDAAVSDEFSTVGYRLHSMIHGEFEPTVPATRYSPARLAAFRAQGVRIEPDGARVTLVIPVTVAFGNPDLLQAVGLAPILRSLAAEPQYANDEQIDNSLRSVLFEVPRPGVTDPDACGTPIVESRCYTEVSDLAAIDVARGRDHGMPSYNGLRRAYGLAPQRSFTAVTGERTDRFPPGLGIDDPHSLDFVALRDVRGRPVAPGADGAVVGVRRTTLAARLKALYGRVDRLDAFVGMVSEPHVPGSELGPLQLAIFKRQFEALRDGDRFFYAADHGLQAIRRRYGIDYRRTLSQVIRADTRVAMPTDLFRVAR
ncbi:MAG TPA: peroxidase family protein [Solirubrobacteraceae bacterium]